MLIIVIHATLTACASIVARKWFGEYMMLSAPAIIRKIASCGFCLCFWMGWIILPAVWFLVPFPGWWFVLPFTSAPIAYRLA